MEFRKSTEADLSQVITIIEQAKHDLKMSGVNQWQTGYPDIKTLQHDLFHQQSYVLVEGDEVIASTAISFEAEQTYQTIYDGQWLSELPYAVVHRFVVKRELKSQGVGSVLFQHVENLCAQNKIKSIKVDTHEDNQSMQYLLKKNQFRYCGIIYLTDGDKRLAFEKLI